MSLFGGVFDNHRSNLSTSILHQTNIGKIMEQQNTEQLLQEVQNQLVATQSRSYELISNITRERDEARANANKLDQILSNITSTIGLEAPVTIENLLQEIANLASLKKKGKK